MAEVQGLRSRGPRIYGLAAWIAIIIDVCDRLSIPTEVLGYTTRAWKGGQSRELWLRDGRPSKPGRLNDLRHIIYKSFAESARVAAPSLGVMANEGVLKENVDGEALLWAYSRLPAADRSKNIIVVLADGASVDDSTMAVNATGFLTLHAALVSRFVGAQPGVQLIGIGIDVDVSSIYEESYTIDPDNIGICLMNSLRQYIN